jgi:pimeloyl-ACP methyl ester carboxylesterase
MVQWWLGSAKAMGIDRCFLQGLLTYFYSERYCNSNQEKIEKSVEAMLKVHRPLHGYLHTGHGLLTHDSQERLCEIQCPTQILIGQNDLITTLEQSQDIARRIPHSELLVFEDTLHGFMAERPDAFDSIMQFFARH